VRFLIPVVTSAESAARDAAAIGDGIPSRALMQRAGAAAAGEITLRYRDRLDAGVLVLAGPGNNGGDAWVVAAALASAGARVRVVEPIASKTSDAQAERAVALRILDAKCVETGALSAAIDRGEGLVVDGLLGTGSSGAPRGDIAAAIEAVNAMRERGAVVVALDVPSGLDASTGEKAGVAIIADLTVTFATIKRGHLIDRDACGTIVVLDIGIGANVPLEENMPRLVDERWVASQIPAMAANAHKGTRKKIAIVGGARGMAGAPMLAARAALRSGAGMVKLVVAPDSVPVIQEAEPHALAAEWPGDDAAVDEQIVKWADAVVIGPGLGRTDKSRALLERVLRRWVGPTLLDADAITLFEGRSGDLASALGHRAALLTPHPVEFARLAGSSADRVLSARFEVGREMASALSAVVLLKGVPTVITSSDGRCMVSASGTPALATGGSGDVLSGVAGTLLAQLSDPLVAGAAAAWVHGRAAERVPSSNRGDARGITLDDVIGELRDAWTFDARPSRYPVLAELPALGASR
jgi:ADP-dependent NAD(P)H-hydrate dehydratase / NAD(P)H-hydrate epimerase